MKPKTGGRDRRKANANARTQRKLVRGDEKRAQGLLDTLRSPIEGPQHKWEPADMIRVASLFPAAIRATKPVGEAVLAITAPATISAQDRLAMLEGVADLYRLRAWHEAKEKVKRELRAEEALHTEATAGAPPP